MTDKKSLFSAYVLGVALSVAAAAPAFAQAQSDLKIVIRQQSEDIETLNVKSDNPWIDLSEGQYAVITENGTKQILKGPFHGRLNKARQAMTRQVKATEIAQVRTAVPTGMTVPAGVNVADLSLDGGDTQCLIGQTTHLWRSDATAPLTLLISLIGGPSRTLTFNAGQSVADWPAGVALKAEGEYVLAQPDSDTPTRKFRLVTAKGEATDKLADAGCVHQARVAAELKARAGQ